MVKNSQAGKNYSEALAKAERTYLRQTHEAWAKLMADFHLATSLEETLYRHDVAVAEERFQKELREKA